MPIKLNIAQATHWHQELGRRYWPTVIKGAKLGAYRGQALLQERSSLFAFDRGSFKRAWKISVDAKGVRFFNIAQYAGVIEYGRRAGARMPPPEVLVPWVRRHLTIIETTRKGTERRRKPRKGNEAERLAFVVARAIKNRGIDGKYILQGAINDLREMLEWEIQKELSALWASER